MRTVKMETIVAMRNELSTFKMNLLKALENGTTLPTVDSNMILEKYIKKAVSELKGSTTIYQAKRMARATLTDNMLDVLN